MSETVASLRDRACTCRRMAQDSSLEKVAAALNEIAVDYDRQANRAERAEERTRGLLNGRPG